MESEMNMRTFITAAATIISGVSTVAAGTLTFSNTNAIVINDSTSPPTVASPYPSSITVSNITAAYVTKVTVQIHGFAHTFPSDVDIVLLGPGGQNSVLMGNVGTENQPQPATNIDLTIDDEASSGMPLDADLVSGTYRPTQRQTFAFDFPAPAPATSNLMGPTLANFKGTNPNGTWSLYIVDDTNPDSGVITGGWSLTLTTAPVLLSIARAQTNVIISWTNAATGYTLQASPSLSSPAWTNIAAQPAMTGGNFVVTNALGDSPAFYRLTK